MSRPLVRSALSAKPYPDIFHAFAEFQQTRFPTMFVRGHALLRSGSAHTRAAKMSALTDVTGIVGPNTASRVAHEREFPTAVFAPTGCKRWMADVNE
jgi:hypothetical protein